MYFKESALGLVFGSGFGWGGLLMNQNLSEQSTVEELLWDISDGFIGVPLTLASEGGWWYRAYNKYFLEDGKKTGIHLLGSKEVDETKSESFKAGFREGCEILLWKTIGEISNEEFLRVQKWCVTYINLQLSDFSSNSLKAFENNFWKDNKDKPSTDDDVKKIVEEIKKTLNSDAKNRSEDKKALYRWCSMSMNASSEYYLKRKVKSMCFSG